MKIAEENRRSPAQQITFLVDLAEDAPSDKEVTSMYHCLKCSL